MIGNLIDSRELSHKIGVSQVTCLRLAKAGRFDYYKVGKKYLFTEDSVNKYLECVYVNNAGGKYEH